LFAKDKKVLIISLKESMEKSCQNLRTLNQQHQQLSLLCLHSDSQYGADY
jgi:hypothetical protein